MQEWYEYFKNKIPKIIGTFLNKCKLTVILEMFTRFFGLDSSLTQWYF